MAGKFIPLLILIIMMNACALNPQPTSTLHVTTYMPPASTNTPAIPTYTRIAPTKEPSPTPAYSSTFTPIAPLQPDDVLMLTHIHMMNESNGWGIEANGHIVHTKDGATTWQDVTPPQGAYTENGFFALDGKTSWATPYCLGSSFGADSPRSPFCDRTTIPNHTFVWVTHDGGNNWKPSHVCLSSSCEGLIATSAGSMYPEFIRFFDDKHGWLSISLGTLMNQDRYNIFYTEDGGEEWNFIVSNFHGPMMASLTAVEALDMQNIILTSNNIYGAGEPNHDLTYAISKDGGKKWEDFMRFSPPDNPIGDPLWDSLRCGTLEVEVVPPPALSMTQECIFRDESPGDHGFYGYRFVHFHSMNGGETWNYWQQTGDVDFINEKTGWQLVSRGKNSNELQQTHDGGLTWSKIKTVEWDGALNFINEQVGWALAYQEGVMAVVKTTDGGRTWEIKTQAKTPFVPCTLNTWSYCDHY